MLKLTRNKGEKIIITHEESGDKIVVEVLDINANRRRSQVYLGIQADRTFLIDREEIYLEKKAERGA